MITFPRITASAARIGLTLLMCAAAGAAEAQPETVEIFSAGSLRGVVNGLAAEAAPGLGVEVQATFGGSGLLRERIEKGATPDLFLSADLASPRKLEAAGHTVVPALAIARNRMCIVTRPAANVSADNLIERLLDGRLRVKTSTPVADPAGDYAWAIFDRIDALHPGSGAMLKDRAQSLWSVTAPAQPGQHPYAALFAAGLIDLSITYCSGLRALEKDAPGIVSFPVPAALDPHPVDGLAILTSKPGALRLALYLLSDKGQALVAREGLVPLGEPGNAGNAAPR
ncbi:MAG: substrate-binding domain-containing protein [Gammaproteobacteria bacterium]|nr:substrate-binding domain-containing protein [Gammaproteobacteria bacterium]